MSPNGTLVGDYQALVAALADRRRDLGITQFELDQRAGLQDGYTGKVEAFANPHGRGIGPLVLPLLLQSLGVVLLVMPLARPRAVYLRLEDQLELSLVGGGVKRLDRDLYHRRYKPLKTLNKVKEKVFA